MSIVVSVPKAVIFEDIDRALKLTLAGIAVLALVVLVLAYYGAQRLVLGPIRALLDMAGRVRSGEFGARTGIGPARDELSRLGSALDEMAAQLEEREAKLSTLMAALQEQATTDPLTGLYNRRYFADVLEREVLSAQRSRRPFSLVMLDIDHFKKVNDTWGHDVGDLVLKAIAKLITEKVRGSDVAARHGGEEFVLLLSEATAEGAAERAEALRRALEAMDIAHDGGSLRVAASFGVAEFGDARPDAAALMKTVDEALYAAKAGGRNKVVVSRAG